MKPADTPRRETGTGPTVYLSLLAASGWLLYACGRMWWQPILADEWDFFRAMADWQKYRALIPHPQAYVHLGQLSMALFGPSASAARLVGVGSALASLWLIPALSSVFWQDHPQRRSITVLAVTLTALNPLTLQNAMLVDIDNTILIPATMLLVWTWGEMQTRSSQARVCALALVLAGTLWVKLPTPPLFIGGLWLFHLAQRQWTRAVELVVASVLGLVLFLLTFAGYSHLSGYEWAYFGPTLSRGEGFLNVAELLIRFPQGLGVFVMWLTLPVTLLSLVALLVSIRRILLGRATIADALSLCVIVMTLFYTIFHVPAWGYPRYLSPTIPLLMALVAATVIPHLAGLPARAKIGLALVLAGFVALNLWLWPDPLYPLYSVTFEGDLFDLRRRIVSGLSIVGTLSLPLAGVLGAAWVVARVRSLPARTIGACLLVVFSLASLLSIDLTQIEARYSTRYRYTYDYSDYFWSVHAAQAMGPAAYVLAIKDTLYESQLAGDEIYAYICPTCATHLLDTIHARKIDALVLTTKEETRAPEIFADVTVKDALAACYDRQTRGVFIAYLLKPNLTCR